MTLAFAAMVLSLTACGSSSTAGGAKTSTRSDASSTNAAPRSSSGASRSADAGFVARANAICRKLNREIATNPAKNGSRRELLHVVPRNESSERVALKELSALAPAARAAGPWRQMLALRREAIAELGALVTATRHDDRAVSKTIIARKKRLHARLKAVATEAGLTECASLG